MEARDFITRLLDKIPTTRLGSQNGAAEILEHPWFNDLDLNALEALQLTAPFHPNTSDGKIDPRFYAIKKGKQLEMTKVPATGLRII